MASHSKCHRNCVVATQCGCIPLVETVWAMRWLVPGNPLPLIIPVIPASRFHTYWYIAHPAGLGCVLFLSGQC